MQKFNPALGALTSISFNFLAGIIYWDIELFGNLLRVYGDAAIHGAQVQVIYSYDTAVVPLPAAAWLFISGLAVVKRKQLKV